VEKALAERDARLVAAQRTIEDLKTNVGMMHVRLETMQASYAQVGVHTPPYPLTLRACDVPKAGTAVATVVSPPPRLTRHISNCCLKEALAHSS
jgi:hypothetical protein